MTSHSERLDGALSALREQVQALVREEQLRDQLTGLANGQALSEWLKQAIEGTSEFWLALVEVDHFKRINDKFSYELADGLLKKIGGRLQNFGDYVSGSVPIRAHGDEFYLVGLCDSDFDPRNVHAALELVREEIRGIGLKTDKGTMNCSVSVGWMISTDTENETLTERLAMRFAEAATAAAKVRGRNRVVRYSIEVAKAERQSIRDDCAGCRSSFTVEVPLDTEHKAELFCPNCGARVTRP